MTGRAAVTAVVRDAIESILPGVDFAALTGAEHLKDLGADSVDRVEIILTVLDRLGLRTPMSRFGDIPSVSALVDFLCEVSGP